MRCLAVVAACLAGPATAQSVEILDGYSNFDAPGPMAVTSLTEVLPDWAFNLPESTEGAEGSELTVRLDGGRAIVEHTSGGGDDSVGAAQRRYEFEMQEDGLWRLVAYGQRQKCLRGGDPEAWVATPCL